MKDLQVLEKKIMALGELVQELKLKNAVLSEENSRLMEQRDLHEQSKQQEMQRIQLVDKETAATKKVIDDLIQHIDSFIECEQQ